MNSILPQSFLFLVPLGKQVWEAYEFMGVNDSMDSLNQWGNESEWISTTLSPWVDSSFCTILRRSGWDWASVAHSGGLVNVNNTLLCWLFLSLSLSLWSLTTAPWVSIYFRSCFSLTFRRTQDSSIITLLSSFFVFLCLLRTLSHSLQNCGITFEYNVHYHSGMNSVSSFECVIKSIDLSPCIFKTTLEFRVCISIHFLRVGFFVYGELLWRKQRYIIHCAWFRKFVE